MKTKRLTAKEAAVVIGVKYQTLLNWHSVGSYADSLQFHKTPSGRLYLMSNDVEKFAREYSI